MSEGTAPTSDAAQIRALTARLSDERASVRRIAARDLFAVCPLPEPLCSVVVDRIIVETDDAARHLLVRLVGARLMQEARPVLDSLMADRATTVLVAHEARVSLDRLDLARLDLVRRSLDRRLAPSAGEAAGETGSGG